MSALFPTLGAVVITILITTAYVNAGPPENEPTFTYNCSGNAVNKTTVRMTNANYINLKVLKEDGNYCAVKDVDSLRTCFKNVQPKGSGTTDPVLTIIYENEDDSEIVGGNNVTVYVLKCTEKSTMLIAKTNKTVNAGTRSPPVTVRLPISTGPTLEITPREIYIGDKIQLKLSVDKDKYKVMPTNCTASVQESGGNQHLLWKNCTSADTSIMPSHQWTSKASDEQSVLLADMFAFRFIDSAKVFIMCETYVCPKGEADLCNMPCLNETIPERRKRNSGNLLKSKTYSKPSKAVATVSFNVLSHREQLNSANGLSFGCHNCLVIAWICCMTIMRGL